jgi:hypothetical protein
VGGRSGDNTLYNLHRIDAWRMATWQLALHVTGIHRWARRQPVPRTMRRLAAHLV